MKQHIVICTMLLMVFSVQGADMAKIAAEYRLKLVDNGRANASIVIAANATCSAQFAAAELQYHINKITGAILPIVTNADAVKGVKILVGASQATFSLNLPGKPFEPQEYLIRFMPETIVLMGKDADRRTTVKYDENAPLAYQTWPKFFEEYGTCCAVYDFLERYCGVRWFRPGELGLICPEAGTLEVGGQDIRRSPEFKYRNPYPFQISSEGYDRETGLWNKTDKNKTDKQKCDEVEELAYPDFKAKWPNIHSKRGMIRLFLLRIRLSGGEPYHANHSFYGYYDRFWQKNPNNPTVFEGGHPEWFAQGYGTKLSPIKEAGKSDESTGYDKPPQMCFSNPEFIRQVVRDARDYFDGKGNKSGAVGTGDYFALVPMDNASWCKCTACQALLKKEPVRGKELYSNDQASDYVFTFVNKVAREVRKSHPDKYIVAVAYEKYAYPPSQERLESNVAVSFCLQMRAVYAPSVQENDRKILQAWDTAAKGNRFFLHLYYLFPVYSANLGNFHCFPGFFAHGIDKWFKIFHNYGIRGAFYEGLGQDVELYVTCKLMDDPTLNVDKLLDEYFTGMYGPAAKPMKELYLKIEEIYSNPANYSPDADGQTAAWKNLGTAERMAELGKLMAQAHAAAKTDVEKARVKLFDKQIWEYMTVGRQKYLERMQASIPSASVPKMPDAGGDSARIDWNKAIVLSGWSKMDGGPADRKLEARLAHDNRFLYIQLVERVDPKTLQINHASIWNDDWEIFFARQRALPYRQIGLGPTGKSESLAWGAAKSLWDSGVAVVSDTSAPDCWTTRLALPLEKLLPGGVKSGDKFYLNFIRAWNVNQQWHQITWSPFSAVHQVDRLGEVTLE